MQQFGVNYMSIHSIVWMMNTFYKLLEVFSYMW